jgi:hypothetical protein
MKALTEPQRAALAGLKGSPLEVALTERAVRQGFTPSGFRQMLREKMRGGQYRPERARLAEMFEAVWRTR